MRLGFVGAGAITEAIVTGLLREGARETDILLSPRGADVAGRLADRHPGVVRIAADNQAVLEGCDMVFVAVRPQIVREVLAGLRFKETHVVVSLVAMLSLEELSPLVAPAARVLRAIPLPAAAEGRSPTALMPPDPTVAALFERVGTVTEVSDPTAFDALAAASGTMAAHFSMAAAVAGWLAEQGLPQDAARDYVGRILSGLARTADASPTTDFARLAREHTTPGGLNEQLERHLGDSGAFEAMRAGLDGLHRRIREGR